MADGVSITDFAEILTDFGRTISLQRVTKTNDPLTGEETSSYASASNVTVIFFLEEQRWQWDKEGLVELGDAYVIATKATALNRYDKFTVDGDTYIIEKIIPRYILTTSMHDFCVCYKIN